MTRILVGAVVLSLGIEMASDTLSDDGQRVLRFVLLAGIVALGAALLNRRSR